MAESGPLPTGLSFRVVDARADRYAASPTVLLRVQVTESSGAPVHAVALRAQVRIEPARRRYDTAEEEALVDLFGSRSRWGDTLKPLQLAFVSHVVPSFTGVTEVDLPLPCSCDLEVAAHKYLYGLHDGVAPLLLLFSGTWFARGDNGFEVRPIPWDREASFGLPVAAWREAMEQHFPGSAWLRLDRETYDELYRYRASNAMLNWGRGGPPVAQGGRRVTTFEDVRPLADTVLYEGYALYPYRANDQKNQVRWQFGVLMPPQMVAADPSERSGLTARLLAEGRGLRYTVRLRFLQAQRRTVERYAGDGSTEEVSRLEAGDTAYLPFDEAVPHELDVEVAVDGRCRSGSTSRAPKAPRRFRVGGCGAGPCPWPCRYRPPPSRCPALTA